MANVTRSPELIFGEAIEIESPSDRRLFLEQACQGDDEALRAVERLVADHFRAGSFLEVPAADIAAAVGLAPAPECPGTVIGAYKLLEQIGEGGFGVVYMAEQTHPVRRIVALKIIKPGMDTRQVIARFEAERQALAMMDHPNIAKVLDAGTTGEGTRGWGLGARDEDKVESPQDLSPQSQVRSPHIGRPYFVMELVRGVPITEYCDQCNLTTRERLELFISVCQAVQHAHQKGVIHRDIKPTNVLVAMQDGQPTPKIIDFGVAKAINQRLTEHTLATGFAQMLGTPLYMSPEQAELSPLGVDTRSDIYSLGVLLYELLTSTTPFDKDRLHSLSYDELRRIIREEEPPRPSARISTLAADLATTMADRRCTDGRRLRQTVRGELDWIVMKCLEKDRNRRYDAASSLRRDIERYLHDEAVQACPPSAAYRLQKFARRNRAVLISAGLVATALVVGTAVSISQAIRATQAESLATARLTEATDARANAEANADKARLAVDDMYTQVAEKWLAHQPQMEPLQREFLEKALRFYTEFADETSNDPTVRSETARAFRRIADIQHRLGEPAQAESAFKRAIDHMQALADEFANTPAYRAELAATLHKFGVLLGDTGRYPDEEESHRRARSIEEQLATAHPTNAAYRRDHGRGHWYVAQVLASVHRRQEAEQAYRSALAIQRPLAAEFPSLPEYREHLAESQLGLGQQLRHLGRSEECQQAFGEAADLLEHLAAEFSHLAHYRSLLANAYYWRTRVLPPSEEAEQYLRQTLVLQEKLADDFPAVADYRYDLFRSQKSLAFVLGAMNRPDEAETAYREAVANAQKLIADSPSVHYYRGGLALTYLALGEFRTEGGRLRDAEDAFRQSIALFEKLVVDFPDVPNYGPDLRQTYFHLTSVLNNLGRPQEATDPHRKALQVNLQDPVELNDLAWKLVTYPDPQLRDPQQAIDLAKRAIELAPHKANHWGTLGAAHYRAGDWTQAVAALDKAQAFGSGGHKHDPFFLAMAHWQLGNKEDARKWYAETVDRMENSHSQEKLRPFRAEAAELLGISDPELSTDGNSEIEGELDERL